MHHRPPHLLGTGMKFSNLLTNISDGSHVSTIKVNESPERFESAAFASGDSVEMIEREQYDTAEEARAGHTRMVERRENRSPA